ncbi:hypothetical protein BDZ97DRAFT_122237 [Flammula alnicola]|nr:hypothetical protein BDZ97DRAFT_122237 [Flammula alnicola]
MAPTCKKLVFRLIIYLSSGAVLFSFRMSVLMPATCNNCCSSSSPAMTVPPKAVPRPKGLWKARGTPAPRSACHAPENNLPPPSITNHYEHKRLFADNLFDLDDDRLSSYDSDSSDSSRKRRRLTDSPITSEEDDVLYWDYSRKCSPHPERLSKWTTRTKLMDTSTTAGPGQEGADRTICDQEDWEDLKELFAKAAEIYETQSPTESITLLRGVIHECHRFMLVHQDPSVLYATPQTEKSKASTQSGPERFIANDWLAERPSLYPPPDAERERNKKMTHPGQEKEKKCKCKDLATAFYTILGTTLFFFGNLLDQDPSLALQGEPDTPTPYWLAALDVFEIGENLPIRTSGLGCPSAPEDWRMAIVWGRTLVTIANEVLRRQHNRPPGFVPPAASSTPPFTFNGGMFPTETPKASTPDEPNWPQNSPFALIVARRPPASRRMSLATVTPNELLQLAQDQFSRGIFHMPHPLHSQRSRKYPAAMAALSAPAPFTSTPPVRPHYTTTLSSESTSSSTPMPPPSTESTPTPTPGSPQQASPLQPPETFSRAKELYTIASEMLDIAEKLDLPSERETWATWADSVFSQMKMEADMHASRADITFARGRCNLVVGSAKAEELEARIEAEDESVYDCEDAIDGRDALTLAVTYLEKAREALVGRGEEAEAEGPAPTTSTSTSAAASVVGDEEEMIIVETAESDTEESQQQPRPRRAGSVTSAEDREETIAELGTLLAEALITLANLTKDAREREALYSRAQKESGDAIELDDPEWADEDRDVPQLRN